MTRKHVEAITKAIKRARITTQEADNATYYNSGVACAASYIADALAELNPRFDRARFLRDCGVPS